MVEVKGFEKAYEFAVYTEEVKKLAREHKNSVITKCKKELIANGVDAETAQIMAKAMWETKVIG